MRRKEKKASECIDPLQVVLWGETLLRAAERERTSKLDGLKDKLTFAIPSQVWAGTWGDTRLARLGRGGWPEAPGGWKTQRTKAFHVFWQLIFTSKTLSLIELHPEEKRKPLDFKVKLHSNLFSPLFCRTWVLEKSEGGSCSAGPGVCSFACCGPCRRVRSVSGVRWTTEIYRNQRKHSVSKCLKAEEIFLKFLKERIRTSPSTSYTVQSLIQILESCGPQVLQDSQLHLFGTWRRSLSEFSF